MSKYFESRCWLDCTNSTVAPRVRQLLHDRSHSNSSCKQPSVVPPVSRFVNSRPLNELPVEIRTTKLSKFIRENLGQRLRDIVAGRLG